MFGFVTQADDVASEAHPDFVFDGGLLHVDLEQSGASAGYAQMGFEAIVGDAMNAGDFGSADVDGQTVGFAVIDSCQYALA